MLQLIFLLSTLLACLLFYLTNKQQKLFASSLPKRPWRLLAYGVAFVSLIGWLSLFTLSAAIFIWLALLMLLMGLVPFISLFGRK
ncbi:hypothetical protein Q4Q54_20640 [Shewanella sp. SP2S2-4]|uniref:DUF3325 domain-containing protein n=2 Tax=Shewanella TaxID=22 RepID=A0A9X2WXE6_9GAMM|nr:MULTISPECIES: hypothetical protein [Shewanella]EGT3625202.1 hypothetical protein [Morganella morganii]MBU1393828.1 hypothetical protein [Gammaproteobacteria bacterium]MCI2964571.1 hypothetical protein [Shewanella sp. N2AIL]MCT7947454.1 hypothetical protein [Shewanella septentrionalis]QYX64338.1 hypothetical protein K2227_19595 [Shewanella putrefaciens]